MAKHTLKICGVNTTRFLKYVWPFYNIMHERVNSAFRAALIILKGEQLLEVATSFAERCFSK